MAKYIAGPNDLTDEFKADFITYTIEQMALNLHWIFNSGAALQIPVCENLFKNKQTGNTREYLILGINDALYCVYCLSYSGKDNALCKTGLKVSDSNYALQAIKRHETTKYHNDSVEKYQIALSSNGDNRKEQIKRNRYTVQKIIEAIVFVSTSGNLISKLNQIKFESNNKIIII